MSDARSYVARCQVVAVEPCIEFVNALSTGAARCSLSERGRPLGDKDVGCVADALRDSKITDLDLSTNAISIGGAEDIAAALRVNATLARLHVGSNDIRDEGTLYFAAALKDNTRLTELDLSANNIGDHGVAGLAEILGTNRTLKVLDLQRNLIQCQGLVFLAEPLKVNNVLQVLNLSSNQIADTGACALGGSIAINSTLTAIDLAGNAVGDIGGDTLAAGLSQSLSLRELSLDSNKIGDRSAISFAKLLASQSQTEGPTKLAALNLARNAIGVQGCVALADSLKYNISLRYLHLQGIPMTRPGALAFAETIHSNQSMVQLDIDLEAANTHGAQAIAEAMRSNTTITELDLGAACPLDAAAVAEVDNTLRINKFLAGTAADDGLGEMQPELPPANAAAVPGISTASLPKDASQPPSFMDYLAPSAARAEPFTYDEGAMLGGHSQEISAVHNTSEAAQRVGPGPGVAGAAQGASQSGVLASMLEHVGGHAAEHPAAAQHQRGFQSAVHNSALTDPQPSQAATAPLSAQQSAAGQQSPKAMLEMLRRKLDVFQTDTGRPNSQGSNSQGIAAAPPPVALAQPISAAVPAGGVVPAGLAVLSADPAVSEHYAAAMDRAPSAFAGHRTTAAHRASDSPPSGALDMMPRPGPAAGPSQERAGASTGCSPAVIETLAARIAAVEAQCTATIAGIRADLDRRLGTAISAFQAEDQAKQYVQEIRVEQLARRISALEANDSAAAAAAARPGGAGAAVGGGSAADPTQVVEQIVDLLRGVDKLTKKVGAVEVQMKGGAGKFGGGKDRSGAGGGGWAPADIENRFRRLEVEQRESLREMERRVNAKMEVVLEARLADMANRMSALEGIGSAFKGDATTAPRMVEQMRHR